MDALCMLRGDWRCVGRILYFPEPVQAYPWPLALLHRSCLPCLAQAADRENLSFLSVLGL